MISANELRTGITFEIEGDLFVVISYQHIKPGKGSPFVRLKMKSLITGNVYEKTFRPDEKLKSAYLEHKKMQYLYKSGEEYFMMDTENYEQISLKEDDIGDNAHFLKENMMIEVSFYKGKAVGVEIPTFVELLVTHTEQGIKGDTATGAQKPATVETGYILQVPLFVNEGDVIRIDTRTGEYLERVK